MSTYRIFFRDEKNWICGRQDFEADTEQAAIRIAHELADACSDVSGNFELWDGHQLVVCERCKVDTIDQLNERHQEIVLRTEEAIRLSHWRIAESHRLIARLDSKIARR